MTNADTPATPRMDPTTPDFPTIARKNRIPTVMFVTRKNRLMKSPSSGSSIFFVNEFHASFSD